MSGGITQCIFNFSTRWRQVANFMVWLIYPQGNKTCYPLDRRLDEARAGLDAAKKRKISDSAWN
jgi:hypothetical protein